MWDPYAEFETTVLPNGLTVHAAHWPKRPWLAVGFVVHSGAKEDTEGYEGTAHFVEHLVSANHPLGSHGIRAFFRECGGAADLGSTSFLSTHYDFFAPADKKTLSTAFEIFGDMLLMGKLQGGIEKERHVIVQEFFRRFPQQWKFDIAQRVIRSLYSGCFLERMVRPLGEPKTIGCISPEVLQSFYDQYYTPANISVVSVGGLPIGDVADILSSSSFGKSKDGQRTTLPDFFRTIPLPSEQRIVVRLSEHTNTPSACGSYSSTAMLSRFGNRHGTLLLSNVLEEVLMKEIREKCAWTYSISTHISNYGPFETFSILCDNLALPAVEEIEAVVDRCIESLRDDTCLFERFKNYYRAASTLLDKSGREVRDAAMTDLRHFHRIVPMQEDIVLIEALTLEDITALALQLRPEHRCTLISCP